MKITLKNNEIVTPLGTLGIPLHKNLFAQRDNGQIILITTKGDLQLEYEPGVSNWTMGSTAKVVDDMTELLVQPLTIKVEPPINEPTE